VLGTPYGRCSALRHADGVQTHYADVIVLLPDLAQFTECPSARRARSLRLST
jgi:hypothetical protein